MKMTSRSIFIGLSFIVVLLIGFTVCNFSFVHTGDLKWVFLPKHDLKKELFALTPPGISLEKCLLTLHANSSHFTHTSFVVENDGVLPSGFDAKKNWRKIHHVRTCYVSL